MVKKMDQLNMMVNIIIIIIILASNPPAAAEAVRRVVEVYHPFPFTPDGIIRQLQHAQQAVNRGSLSLAIAGKEGVVLAGERRQTSPLAIGSPKIGKLDSHIIYIMSGIVPDGRYLIKKGRLLSQKHWFEYGEEVGLPALLMDLRKVVTSAHYRAPSSKERGGGDGDGGVERDFFDEVRPQASIDPIGDAEAQAKKEGTPARHFGVGFLFAGPRSGREAAPITPSSSTTNDHRTSIPPWVIYEMGPSGMFLRWDARAIGAGSDRAESFLESYYQPGLSLEACKRLAVQVCEQHVLTTGGTIEMATLTRDAKGQAVFERLNEKEIEEIRQMVASEGGLVSKKE